ncbi:flavin reductase [Methylobacterium nonmethylotrophicum]|uniref:Flavin reductase n=1 Tax=Methylobacterium nonmethylotrophicum TaxID=1141884 RepID=A0A4Z0NE60_9HYPH|nr:flavin reductase [Methylobacterium nonmethylotrophicum]TGD94271.1 flavin reductase [Methylobacterium nonmethylotrophicum]
MRQLAAAVTIVTTIHEGVRAGMTATAVMSLTAEPPQLGIAVNRSGASCPAIAGSGVFAVNVLRHDQAGLARRFAGADGVKGEERFTEGRWSCPATGSPVLLDGAAAFDCRVVQAIDLSSHVLFVGQVEAILAAPAATPLLFMDGTWASLVRANDHDFRAYEQVIGRIDAAIEAAVAKRVPPAQQLDDFIQQFSQISAGSLGIVREFFDREAVAPAQSLHTIDRLKRGVEGKLTELLAHGTVSGDFDVADPAVAAHAIIGLVNSVHRWPEESGAMTADALGGRVGALVTAMVLRGGSHKSVDSA